MMNGPLLVVDGTNLAHRCWHATGGQQDPARGVTMLAGLLKAAVAETEALSALIAFDGPAAGAHRYALYPAYKSGRGEKDTAIADLIGASIRTLERFGWRVYAKPYVEADDVLAHYASDLMTPTVLLTADKDALGYLGHPNVAVLRVRDGGPAKWQLITSSNLVDHVGVTAEQYELFSVLKGDTSDSIPGVPGIGEVLARSLATALTTVEAFMADLRAGGSITRRVIGKGRTAKLTMNYRTVAAAVDLTRELYRPMPLTDAPPRLKSVTPGNQSRMHDPVRV